MFDKNMSIQQLKDAVEKFIKERDWEQFHNPKNLSMSIAIEAAELMEKFQWLEAKDTKNEVLQNKKEIEEELADVVILALTFSYQNNIDLSRAILSKLELNSKKYPADKCKGKSDKYTKYQNS